MEHNLLQSMIGTLSLGLQATQSIQQLTAPAKGGSLPAISMFGPDGREHLVFDGEQSSLDTVAEDANRYHVVYVLGGTIYFGQLRVHPQTKTVGLDDAHYLVANKSPLASLQLIRVGQELHAPRGEMTVNMTYVVSWQKLDQRSAIMTAICNGRGLARR